MKEDIIGKPEEKIQVEYQKKRLLVVSMVLAETLIFTAGRYIDLLWQERMKVFRTMD